MKYISPEIAKSLSIKKKIEPRNTTWQGHLITK